MQPLSDEILMARVKADKLLALGHLYERYKNRLLTYCIRITRDQTASKDLLMNTFERIYKYRKSYREGASFKSWCFQIANNLIKDYFKQEQKQKDRIAQSPAQVLSTVDQPNMNSHSYQGLYEALDRLSAKDKRIVTQYYLLELPYNEIATLEGITINTARIRVCRALKELKQYLIDQEYGKG